MNYEDGLAFAKELAAEAGGIMLRYFRTDDSEVRLKDDKTLLTLADEKINRLVIERVQAVFPKHSVHGEEEVMHVKNATFTWVCDPVDGTQPFVKGIPISTFSIALVDNLGRSIAGVVYDPFQDRLFEGVRGKGARMNGKRLNVSDKNDLDGAYIDEELWLNEKEGVSFDDPKDSLNKKGAKVTTLCSACITGCLVAEGSYDAMLFGQSKPEDIAALSVIVEEAGGKVTNLRGADQRYDQKIYGAIVSNGKIHDELVNHISEANYVSKNVR